MNKPTLRAVLFPPVVFNTPDGDLSPFLAPPYDVIDAERCQHLFQQHPHNVVRLILPPLLNEGKPSRYEEAAALWRQWLAEGVLVADDEPSLFVYAQRFPLHHSSVPRLAPCVPQIREHIALLTTIPLFHYDDGVVRPHEHTLPKTKNDRLTLLRAMGAELGQVHGLLSDETGEWHQLLQSVTQNAPWLKGALDGIEHMLWRVTDPSFVDEVNRLLADQWLVIADGHHRYETALSFREEIAAAREDPSHPANFIGIVLADYQRNATVLPTYRLLRFADNESVERVLHGLRRQFRTHTVSWDGSEQQLAQIFDNAGGMPFLFVAQERTLLVTVQGVEGSIVHALEQLPPPLRQVNTAVLHQAVLPIVLTEAGVDRQRFVIDYTHESALAFQFAQREGCMAVLLPPVPIALVRSVAAQGYRMPPKTTFFTPKVPSGLVMRQILSL